MFKEFKPAYPRFNEIVDLVNNLVQEQNLIDDPTTHTENQLAVQNSIPDNTDWLAGTGRSFNKTREWEHQFRYLQPCLKNTVIEDYLNWLEVPVYRTRIMLSRPKTCYSIHNDYSPRLHLPLVTNKQCNFVFADSQFAKMNCVIQPAQFIHIPADGRTYWLDTRKNHTFMNGSAENRLHLVMIVKN